MRHEGLDVQLHIYSPKSSIDRKVVIGRVQVKFIEMDPKKSDNTRR